MSIAPVALARQFFFGNQACAQSFPSTSMEAAPSVEIDISLVRKCGSRAFMIHKTITSMFSPLRLSIIGAEATCRCKSPSPTGTRTHLLKCPMELLSSPPSHAMEYPPISLDVNKIEMRESTRQNIRIEFSSTSRTTGVLIRASMLGSTWIAAIFRLTGRKDMLMPN